MSFSRHLLLMVFPSSWSDSKSSQVSRSLPNILSDHCNVWMVSTSCLISKSSISFSKILWGNVSSAPVTIDITIIFHSFVLVLWQVQSTYFSFRLLLFSLCNSPGQQSLILGRFSFFVVDYHKFWSSSRDLVICSYLKIPENFGGRILSFAYTLWLYGKIYSSCPIPSESLSPHSRVLSFPLFVLICCICLLYDRSFHPNPNITYTCYFVTSNLFLL